MVLKNTYFKASIYLIIERVLGILSSVILGVMIANYLKPEIYGRYSLIVAWFGISLVISKIGLEDIMIKEISKDYSKAKTFLVVGFWMRIAASIIVIAISSLFAFFFIDDSEVLILIFFLLPALLFDAFSVSRSYFIAISNSREISVIGALSTLLSLLLKIYCILYELSLSEFITVIFAEKVIIGVGYIVVSKNIINLSALGIFKIEIAYKWCKLSLPLFLSSISIILYMKVDQLMIAYYLDNEALGNYSIAVKFSEAMNFLPGIISVVLLPLLVKSDKHNTEVVTQRLFSFMTLLSLLASVFILCFASLIRWSYLTDYDGFYGVLVIHVWSAWFVYIGIASSKRLVADDYEWIQMRRTAVGLLTNLVLNMFWIPRFGIYGAAYSTLVSYSVSAFFYDLFDSRTRRLFILKLRSLYLKSLFHS